MADGYDVTAGKDGRIFVVLHPGCKIDKDEILALLRELGIDVTLVSFLHPDEVGECPDIGNAAVIIPIDEGTCDLPELDEAGRYCGQAGGRVVVLFGEAFPYEGLHPIAEKYGTQCGWSSDQLGSCISTDQVDSPRSASGSPVTRPGAGQVKC